MATLDELKGTVDHMGDVMDVLASNYTRLTALVEGHGEQLAELRQQTTELRQQTTELRQQTTELKQQTTELKQQTAEIRQQTAEIMEQTAEIREQTAEIKRDGQKTRRLWVAVAQKLDWLDLDEDFD